MFACLIPSLPSATQTGFDLSEPTLDFRERIHEVLHIPWTEFLKFPGRLAVVVTCVCVCVFVTLVVCRWGMWFSCLGLVRGLGCFLLECWDFNVTDFWPYSIDNLFWPRATYKRNQFEQNQFWTTNTKRSTIYICAWAFLALKKCWDVSIYLGQLWTNPIIGFKN